MKCLGSLSADRWLKVTNAFDRIAADGWSIDGCQWDAIARFSITISHADQRWPSQVGVNLDDLNTNTFLVHRSTGAPSSWLK